MRVLVIGSGGREHTICWKLKQSPKVSEVYCAPGNPGIASIAENIAIKVDDIEELVQFAQSKKIDLTVVGPEYPLTLGIVDAFHKSGLRVFGPTQAAARLEGSKYFAKEVMERAGIPTAGYKVFSDQQAAVAWVDEVGAPIVIKDDGLAAGKGVFVCQSVAEAKSALQKLFSGPEPSQVIVEDCLEGKEASFIAVTDGETVVRLAASHDYKRIRDNDAGPNTGGMGTVSPTPHLTPEQEQWVMDSVMLPTVREMKRSGMPYCGFLYAGMLMDKTKGLQVLEFNARLGDPETQVILRRMKGDFFELLYSLSASGEQNTVAPVAWDSRAAVCVVVAAEGYPENVKKGDAIGGIKDAEQISDCIVFHAGTSVDSSGRLVTAGGRVLNVTALGRDVEEAREKAYQAVEQIQFRGKQHRSDIGQA
ncbi:phosphoribosylamine--glycine ligase [Oligoflexia bacterium]|nr:phosphoribosylamine--glycine ligase [Oligoflexia bacterium]